MKKNCGFTLIDIIVGISLMLIVFSGIFGAYQLGVKVVSQSKARITAVALANQKMEMLRNLSYEGISTTPATELITRNNLEYTVNTSAVYIDDPFDGVAPSDGSPQDYKRVEVNVSWPGRFAGQVSMTTDVAP